MKLRLSIHLLALASLLAFNAPAAQQPNVLFIAIDDLRDWVGYLHHNEQTKTPNIDRLAKMGTALRNAVVSGLSSGITLRQSLLFS